MANTYSQIYIHAVFAVQNRKNLIAKEWRDDLHKYIAGIITNEGAKSLAVGGWKDHVHVFYGMPATTFIPDLMSKLKSNSSKWVNKNRLVNSRFQWQSGYGAFSHSKSQRDTVINYIMNQQEHHKTKTFKEEYLKMLIDFEVEYEENYLFDFL